jgi:hypothetical protein
LDAQDNSQRMLRLQRILADARQARPQTPASDGNSAQVHLASVPLDRIAQVTSELHARINAEIDDVDALAMQVLLNDYATAVAHLRAVARLAQHHVEAAAVPIDEARRFVRRQLKIQQARHGTS